MDKVGIQTWDQRLRCLVNIPKQTWAPGSPSAPQFLPELSSPGAPHYIMRTFSNPSQALLLSSSLFPCVHGGFPGLGLGDG